MYGVDDQQPVAVRIVVLLQQPVFP